MRSMIPLLLVSVLISGCVTDGTTPASIVPICNALIGPIKYNTYNKNSARYAALQLAPDLKRRNQVGQQLGCPSYR